MTIRPMRRVMSTWGPTMKTYMTRRPTCEARRQGLVGLDKVVDLI